MNTPHPTTTNRVAIFDIGLGITEAKWLNEHGRLFHLALQCNPLSHFRPRFPSYLKDTQKCVSRD